MRLSFGGLVAGLAMAAAILAPNGSNGLNGESGVTGLSGPTAPAGQAAPGALSDSRVVILPAALVASAQTVTVNAAPTKLSWRPPVLHDPITITIKDGNTGLKLAANRDYRLVMSKTRTVRLPRGLVITGGHNVVLIGGSVDVGDGYATTKETIRRGMYLKGQTGTIFIEGLRLRSTTKHTLTEGIDLDERLGATVVLSNIAMNRLVGSRAGNHADGIQTWAGPSRLYVDGMFIQTSYQGMFLLPNQLYSGPAPVKWDMRHVTIVGEAPSGYLLWRDEQSFPWAVSNFFVSPGTHALSDRAHFIWDKAGSLAGITPTRSVPNYGATAGAAYRTPGYR